MEVLYKYFQVSKLRQQSHRVLFLLYWEELNSLMAKGTKDFLNLSMEQGWNSSLLRNNFFCLMIELYRVEASGRKVRASHLSWSLVAVSVAR